MTLFQRLCGLVGHAPDPIHARQKKTAVWECRRCQGQWKKQTGAKRRLKIRKTLARVLPLRKVG